MLDDDPNEAADAPASVVTGFDTAPVIGTVNPAPAPATVETGFGDPGGTPAPVQQAAPKVKTVADAGKPEDDPDADLDARVAALVPNKSITDWNAVSAFMDAVVPWPGTPQEPGWITLPNGYANTKIPGGRDPKTGKYQVGPGKPFKAVDALVSYVGWAINTTHVKDIFFVLSLQREVGKSRAGKLQGKKSTAGALAAKAIWLDIDVGKEGAYATVEEALKAAIKFREAAGLPPFSAIVGSGGGIHVYWISDKALNPTDWRPYAEGLKALAAQQGLKFDLSVTTDIARMLRMPGTFNHKQATPRPAQLFNVPLVMHDFSASLGFLSQIAPVRPSASSTSPMQSLFADGADMASFKRPPAFQINEPDLNAGIHKHEDVLLKAEPIFKQCGFYKDALLTGGADYDNALWMYSVLGATFMENGNTIAHAISKGHASYTEADTQALYDRKVAERHDRGLGYPQCSTIQGAGCKSCGTCPLLPRGKSPLNLGIPRAAQSTDDATDAASGPTAAPPPELKFSLSDIPPHRPWLYGVDLLRGDLSLLVSPGGAGKTSHALGMAISLASGNSLLGEKIWGSGPLKSLYINAEDSGIEMRRRALAFCQQHNITVLDRLYIAGTDDLRVRGLSFLSPAGQNSSILDQAGLAHLDNLLASLRPDLVVIDPLIALCGGGNVNDNAAMALVMREIKRLAIKFNCSILIVHHTRKGGDPGSAEAISGASAIKDLARCARMPVTMTTAEMTTFGVLPSERPQYFKLVDAKSNLALHSDETWYKLESQELPNAGAPYPHGDRVQAVVRVQMPLRNSAAATADDQRIEAAILELVDRGKVIDGQAYPYSPSPAGANNERALMPDAMAAVMNATAPRQWLPGDLEAAIKTATNKMQADGRLVVEDMGNLMSKPGRFRRARGLKAVPI
jgi:hypothetical protein